ncbi:MAG: hypothetical protein K0S74_663 [Chlamydiales bacterium]|jgi:hypothetical protein|nr:hypothetical protein [Chlamydiales bacterium]
MKEATNYERHQGVEPKVQTYFAWKRGMDQILAERVKALGLTEEQLAGDRDVKKERKASKKGKEND